MTNMAGALSNTTQPSSEPFSFKELVVRSFRQNIRQYTMMFALLAIWITFSVTTENIFLTPRNLSNLFVQTATTAILGIGMVLVIVAGHIDLSVGSTMGFCGAISAILLINHQWSTPTTVLATLVMGLLIGAWHGYWIAYRKVPAFIVTLASMLGFRGAIIGITGGQTLGLEMSDNAASAESFKAIGQGYLPTLMASAEGKLHDTSLYFTFAVMILFIIFDLRKRHSRIRYGFPVLPLYLQFLRMLVVCALIGTAFSVMIFYMGIPYCIVLVLLLTLIFSFLANNTTFGRHIYAIGGNPDAAKLSGINITRKTMVLFMLMGVLVGLAGTVTTARLNAATTSAGQNAELDAIASAVIGGTSLLGGEGTILGAIVGALVMTSLDNGMSLMNMDITYQYIIKGLILLLAVWVDIATRKRS
jgi:D-xylose transport system permease protein